MELVAKDWSTFVSLVDECSKDPRDNRRHLFRGHSDRTWTISTSISRALPPNFNEEEAHVVEKAALAQFKAVAHFHLPASVLSEPIDAVGWWTLMQHYRAPTRLLDWTSSPYVATYFAVSEPSQTSKDGAVICLDFKAYSEQLARTPGVSSDLPFPEEELFAANSSAHVYAIERHRATDRMAAQQGVFMLSKRVLGNHEAEIQSICSATGVERAFFKIIIPAKDTPYYIAKLRRMNITGHSLFPGADGIGKSISEMIELAKLGITGV